MGISCTDYMYMYIYIYIYVCIFFDIRDKSSISGGNCHM